MNQLKTYSQIKEIVSRVKYLDWQFFVYALGDLESPNALYVLQIQFYSEDMITRKKERQYTRYWMLAPEMTETEIVSTCWNAVKAAVEHEARENFLYAPGESQKGRAVFQPHIDVTAIYGMVSKKDNLDLAADETTGEWVKTHVG